MATASNANATDNKELLNYNPADQIANTLKCGYCMGYLSCGPLKIKNQNICCGRCDVPENAEAVAVPPLEAIMSNFTVPCRYDIEGCKKRLFFNSSLQHEAKCLYRIIPCPALNCETKLSVQTLYDHFQKSHENCLMKDQFKIEITKSSDWNLILKDRGSINIIKYQYNKQNKNLKLSVAAIIEQKKQLSKYKLKIINGKDFENRVCLSQKSCHRHNSSNMEIGEFDIIDIESYFSILNYPEFIYIKITLFYSNEEVISETEINCQEDYLDETNNEEEEQARQLLQKNVCTHCHRQNNYNSSFLKHLQTHAEYCPDPDKIIISLDTNIKYKRINYLTILNTTVIRIYVVISSDQTWLIRCISSDEIKIDVCYTHSHCRLFIKEPLRGPAKLIDFTPETAKLSGCFFELFGLIATLKIFK